MKDYSDIKIDWFGEITAKMGYGLQARRMLKPLLDGGADIKFIPDEDYLPPYMKIDDPYWLDQVEKSKSKPDNAIRVCYTIPHRARPNPQAHNIYYAMWETDQYPKEWASIINNNAQTFFAGCNSLVQSAKKAGITVPIFPMYCTMDINEWNPVGRKMSINEIPDNAVKFLFIGNFIPRKNLEELVIGFSCAFNGIKDVALIIKTWSSANTGDGKRHVAESIRFFNNKLTGLDQKPIISVITDILEENQIIDLIRSTDAYVSVSYGEGFDLPMVQAMCMEKLIVTTRFLAHEDYLDDSNSIEVKHTLMPCIDAKAPMYDSYQMWSRPDMGSYIESLKEAYRLVKEGKASALGKEARKTIESKYGVSKNTDYLAYLLRRVLKDDKKETAPKILIKELVR